MLVLSIIPFCLGFGGGCCAMLLAVRKDLR